MYVCNASVVCCKHAKSRTRPRIRLLTAKNSKTKGLDETNNFAKHVNSSPYHLQEKIAKRVIM